MEAQWYADRATLRHLLQAEPTWTLQDYAEAVGRSRPWVKKWVRRLRYAPPDDHTVLHSRSRARKHPPPSIAEPIVDRILAIRQTPPDNLQRTPGPRTIQYFLERDPLAQASGHHIPTSTNTIWRILRRHGFIAQPPPKAHSPVIRPAPLTSFQLDFKDASTVPADPEGKQQHVVEVLNIVDTGTSLLLASIPRPDFSAATTIETVAGFVQTQGLPEQITFDRDSRFVGGGGHRDVPSAFLRFWLCLNVKVSVCPPHRPDKNAFVERFHRAYNQECLKVKKPQTLEEVEQVTAAFQHHYNTERPNQAVTCQNQPPRRACGELPPCRAVPEMVDPDGWIKALDGQRYVRKVRRNTSVTIDEVPYYVSQELVGKYVVLRVDAATKSFVIEHEERVVKTVPIKGVHDGPVSFADFVAELCLQATVEQRKRTQPRQLSLL